MATEYEMQLTINGETIHFPVLPETFSVKSPGKNETVWVLGLGDINIIREKGLTEISWKSFFPANMAPYVSTPSLETPMAYVNALQNARAKKKHGRFVLVGDGLKISHEVAVESVDYDEKGGEVGDIYYSIKLKQWQNYSAATVAVGTASTSAVAVRSGTPAAASATTHPVAKGDCLWAIAQKYLGDGSKYPQIYAANKELIDARNKGTGNPKYTIYPGQVLTIPDHSEDSAAVASASHAAAVKTSSNSAMLKDWREINSAQAQTRSEVNQASLERAKIALLVSLVKAYKGKTSEAIDTAHEIVDNATSQTDNSALWLAYAVIDGRGTSYPALKEAGELWEKYK